MSALYLTKCVVDFYSAGSLKQRSAGRHCRFTRTHYPDSGSTNLCSLMQSD